MLLGHAHAPVEAALLMRSSGQDGMPSQACPDAGVRWLGWAGAAPSRLADIEPDLDETALALRDRALPISVLEHGNDAGVTSAALLLQASFSPAGTYYWPPGRPPGSASPGV